ncbi:MAG: hypothetical protein J0I20_00555 [Chloroflexi bacterium]|nr:hypothetical protein [Chloroflexota bacterium]OJW00013.1 MAG: hypothetical protein BGO39_27410 [Chloroflexi bacterium 54-19]
MFATVYRLKVTPGRESDALALNEAWYRERAPRVKGFVSTCIVKSITTDGEYLGVTIFDSKENYTRNANDPVQHQWYLRMRECLESDPEWNDGPVISTFPTN